MELPLEISPVKTAGLTTILAPDQKAALEIAGVAARTWISGSDLQKRLEILAALCWNAALHGRTTLVCITPELRAAILEILRSTGLSGLVFDMAGHADPAVIGAFQVARKKRPSDATHQQAEVAMQEYIRWQTALDQRYLSMDKVLFGELTWKEIVDQRSNTPGSAYQHFLSASVHDRFDLSHKEYWHLRGRIKSFSRLRTLRTASFDTLDVLNPALFDDPDASLKDKLVDQLQSIVDTGREVLCVAADAIHAYRQDVTSDHQGRQNEITGRIQHIMQLIAAGETRFGQRFYDESTLTNVWQGIVRGAREEVQHLHVTRNEIRSAFIDFHNYLQESSDPHLDDVAAFMPDPLTVDAIKATCGEINALLEDWTRRVDAHAAEHRKRINAQNISRGEDLRALLRNAETRIEEFVTLLNTTCLLRTAPEINALSLEKKAAAIETTVRLCLRLLNSAPDIDAYTLWTNFWTAQNARTKAILKCLDLMEDSDLVQAFDSWYFGLVLAQIPDHGIVSERDRIQDIHPQHSDLRAALEGHMRAMTQARRHAKLRQIASLQTSLMQSIAKSQLNSFSEELRILPAKDLTELFPVILCTQEQISEYGYYCDALIVCADEGSDHKVFAAQARRCVMLTQSPPRVPGEQWVCANLYIDAIAQRYDWQAVPTSERLPFIESLASQFAGFLKGMRIYNTRDIQIMSFLGDRIDHGMLQHLGLPYKEVGEEGMHPGHIVECFLDRKKPIVLLIRDNKLGVEYSGCLRWHHATIDTLRACGVHVCNFWTLHLKHDPQNALIRLFDEIRQCAGAAMSPEALHESAILRRHVDSGSHTLAPITEDARDRGGSAGL
jgi:hypothetical protein